MLPKRHAKEVRRSLLTDSGIRMMASAGHRVGKSRSPLADPRVWNKLYLTPVLPVFLQMILG